MKSPLTLALALVLAAPAAAQDDDRIAEVREAAEAAYEDREWNKAAKYFKKLVELTPKDGRAWHRLGYVLHAAGKLDKALEIHHKAASFDRYKLVSYYNIACVHSLRNHKDKAFAWLEKAVDHGYEGADHMAQDSDLDNIREDPRYAKLIAAMANGGDWSEKKSEKKSEAYAKKKQKQKKKKKQKQKKGKVAHGGKLAELAEEGAAAFEEGAWKDASEHYARLVEHDPKNGTAWFRLGYALHAQGKLEKALQAHHKAAKFDKFAGLGNYNAACVYAMTKQPDRAFKHLERAIAAGFTRRDHMEQDSDLDALRDDPRYEKMLELATHTKKKSWKKKEGSGEKEHGNGNDTGARKKLLKAIAKKRKQIEKLEAEVEKLQRKLHGGERKHKSKGENRKDKKRIGV